MTENFVIMNGSEFRKELEPVLEMRDEIAALKKVVIQKPPKYYTIKELCALIHVSRSTVYRMIRNGHLKPKKAYRRVLFTEKDVNDLLITVNI